MRIIVAFLLVLICLLVPTYAFAATDIPKVDKSIIYDENGIVVTLLGMDYDKAWKNYSIDVNIKNNTSQDIYYEAPHIIVNGFTINAGNFGCIYAGMEADAQFYMPENDLRLANIEKIMQIKFDIDVFDDQSDERICKIPVSVETSYYGKYEQVYDFEGKEIYNDKGIRVLARLGETVVKPFVLYIENNTDRAILISYNGIAFNNKMTEIFQSGPYVLPNTVLVEKTTLCFFDNEPDIDVLESVAVKLDIMPYRKDGSYTTGDIFETGLLKIEAN